MGRVSRPKPAVYGGRGVFAGLYIWKIFLGRGRGVQLKRFTEECRCGRGHPLCIMWDAKTQHSTN